MSQLLIRYGTLLLFLLLESACFYMVIRYNSDQRAIFTSTAKRFSIGIQKRYDNVSSYLGLREQMEQLHSKNAALRAELETLRMQYAEVSASKDTAFAVRMIPARAFNKSALGNYNWITLDKGEKDGVKPGMGVINGDGIVGIVRGVSENYALVMSVLHRDTRISGAVLHKGNHGLLVWRSSDPRIFDLDYIPKHVVLEPGDTIVSSGYSNIFPEGIRIGTIISSKVPQGQNFYEVKVELDHDFFNVDYVYVVDNPAREEVTRLEASVQQ